jgi:hypothetical protein
VSQRRAIAAGIVTDDVAPPSTIEPRVDDELVAG